MPCRFYAPGESALAGSGRGSCTLNFPIRGRPDSPCHMEAEEKKPEWEACSYNHPAIKEGIKTAILARKAETV